MNKPYGDDIAQDTKINAERLVGVRHWIKSNAKILFIAALVVSGTTVLGASVKMLRVAFSSQPECIAHTQYKNDSQTSHRASKSSC